MRGAAVFATVDEPPQLDASCMKLRATPELPIRTAVAVSSFVVSIIIERCLASANALNKSAEIRPLVRAHAIRLRAVAEQVGQPAQTVLLYRAVRAITRAWQGPVGAVFDDEEVRMGVFTPATRSAVKPMNQASR